MITSRCKMATSLRRNNLCLVLCLSGPDGEIGRRKGLKIPRWKHRAGSIPAPGTILRDCFKREFVDASAAVFDILECRPSRFWLPTKHVASALRLSARAKRFSRNSHLQFSAQKGEAASYAGSAPA